jgi:hypothetical protein
MLEGSEKMPVIQGVHPFCTGVHRPVHTDEVTGSNPVSPTQPKPFQPKRFTLTLACAGCGFRTTDFVESFHKIQSEVQHRGLPSQPRSLVVVPAPQTVRRGRLIWTDKLGQRQAKLLPGEYGSIQSLAAKARLELELALAYKFARHPS